MKLGNFERFCSQINSEYLSASPGHGICQDTTSTTNVQHPLAFKGYEAGNPVQSKRIDLMQGAKFTFCIPPAMRQLGKFGQFGRIEVIGGEHHLIISQA